MEMSKRPTLMLFSHISSNRSITGAEKLLLHFCREVGSYFDCMLVAPEEGKLTTEARRDNISTHIQEVPVLYSMYTPYPELERDIEQLKHSSAYTALVRLIREHQPDLIYVNTCIHVLPALAAKEAGVPVIWGITEIIRSNEYTPLAARIMERLADRLVGISHATLRPLQQAGIRIRMDVLYPTTSIDSMGQAQRYIQRTRKREKLRLRPEHICIGYISSYITESKGLKSFIDMALALCHRYRDCRFWIIGMPIEQEYYQQCEAKIRESGYSRRFRFSKFEESVATAYGAMDMVVIPSMVEEGFGLTALEGHMYGKPVISFAHGGLVEIMQLSGNGDYLVEPGNSYELTAKVAYLIDNREEAVRVSKRNQQESMRMYGADVYRSRCKDMVVRWIAEHPSWFPCLQHPDGALYANGEGYGHWTTQGSEGKPRIRQFPAQIIESLPLRRQESAPELEAVQHRAVPELPQALPPAPEPEYVRDFIQVRAGGKRRSIRRRKGQRTHLKGRRRIHQRMKRTYRLGKVGRGKKRWGSRR